MGDFLGENGKKALAFAAFALGLFLSFKYLFPLLAPFILAFLIVYLCYPWLAKIQKKTYIRKEIFLGGILLLVAALVVFLVWGIFSWTTAHAAQIGDGMEELRLQADGLVEDGCAYLEQQFGMDALETEEAFWRGAGQVSDNIQKEVLPKAAKQSFVYLKQFGSAAAFLGICFISSLLLCRDYVHIREKLEGKPFFERSRGFVHKTVSLIGSFLKAQAIILSVIALVAVAGLLIGRVKGAVLLGVLAGVMDALPFIGTGIVLLPTALFQLLSGNVYAAVMAAVTYVLCIAARELLEPRLLGKQVGIYPVVMLLAVYAGVKLLGLTGLFLGPLYVVLLREGAGMVWETRDEQ